MAVRKPITGPIPNRTNDLSRERDANRGGRPPVSKGRLRDVVVPNANPHWHPIAKMMWDSALNSGMADFYQQSDLAFLYSLMDDLSQLKITAMKYGKVNGQVMTAIYNNLSALGLTEGDRRRMRIELESEGTDEEDVEVTSIERYKLQLAAAQ